MLLGTVNEPVLLSVAAADGRTDLFSRAIILDSAGSTVTTVTLPHQQLGVYGANYTPVAEGYFNVIYQFYFDVLYTVSAGYEIASETLEVSSLKTDVRRILGLQNENTVVDLNSFDIDGNLTSARIRCYNSAANAAAALAISPTAYNTGLTFQYILTATYSGSLLVKYNISRVL